MYNNNFPKKLHYFFHNCLCQPRHSNLKLSLCESSHCKPSSGETFVVKGKKRGKKLLTVLTCSTSWTTQKGIKYTSLRGRRPLKRISEIGL